MEYLENAAVEDWLRPEIGVGWRWGTDARLRLSYRDLDAESTDGRNIDASTLGMNLVFGF